MANQLDSALQSPRDVRMAARNGDLRGPSSGQAPGYLQANLVIVPQAVAFDFLLFCQRNPKPCPILEVLDTGSPEPCGTAPGADLRTDLARYRVFENGVMVDEPTDIRRWWRSDLVAFLLGCSFSFEDAMLRADLPLRHLEEGRTVPMFRTSVACRSSGIFAGPLVVSMRPMTPMQAIRAAEITARFPLAHGAPIHAGDPAALGIADVNRPDFGEPVTIRPGEIPVFWACAVTPQAAIVNAKPPFAITHSPGRMFVTDVRADEQLQAPDTASVYVHAAGS